jgi:hypothetical protein
MSEDLTTGTLLTASSFYIFNSILSVPDRALFKYGSGYIRCEVSHGGDYEDFRLLGYKNPVRTSQETQLYLC